MNPLALAPTTLPDTPTLDFLDAATAAGFWGVSLRLNRSPGLPFHPVAGDSAAMRDVASAIQHSGLAVLEIVSFYLRPETQLEDYKDALAFGASLGAKYALTMGDDPDWARQVDNFGRFCDLAQQFGLTAAVEYAVSRPIATYADTTRLIAAAGRANAVVCLDPLNHIRTSPLEHLIGLDPKLFPYAQITDGVVGPGEPDLVCARANGPNVRRWPGEGDVPLAKMLALLPPNTPLSVEGPALDPTRHSPHEWARIAIEKSQKFLAQQ